MNSSNDIKTGVDQLDQDLKAFLGAIDSGQLDQFKSAVNDRSLSSDELRKSIPQEVIRLVLSLTEPAGFSLLMDHCEENAAPALTRARDIAQQHLAELRSHPAAIEIIKEGVSGLLKQKESERLQLNTISRIGYMTMYLGAPPELNPAVRVAFRDAGGKLLLDSLLDWDDLLYVSKALADIAADEFEAADKLREVGMLDLNEKHLGKLGGHIRDLAKHLQRLQQIAPDYGVEATED